MKCRDPNCGAMNSSGTEVCSKCGKEILSPGERAQVLTTLVQTQENTTWLAFSLAVTTEGVMLAAFSQEKLIDGGRIMLAVAGLFLMAAMFNMVRRSNGDMSILYQKADRDYPSEFHLPGVNRKGFSARVIMNWVIVASIAGWIVLLLLALIYY